MVRIEKQRFAPTSAESAMEVMFEGNGGASKLLFLLQNPESQIWENP